MSKRICGSGAAPASGPVVSCADFEFRLGGELEVWEWSAGPPDWRLLEPVRQPRARALSRHIPASPYCDTTGAHLSVESGLEHDLVRELDRRRDVSWLVSQPLRLRFDDGVTHVPDLLEVSSTGVRVWDVRPRRRQDEDFIRIAGRSEAACRRVGLVYAVFSDEAEVRRSNLRWLSCYRMVPDFGGVSQVLSWLEQGLVSSIGDVLDMSNCDGAVLASLWHLLWRGEVETDLGTVITDNSLLTLRAEG